MCRRLCEVVNLKYKSLNGDIHIPALVLYPVAGEFSSAGSKKKSGWLSCKDPLTNPGIGGMLVGWLGLDTVEILSSNLEKWPQFRQLFKYFEAQDQLRTRKGKLLLEGIMAPLVSDLQVLFCAITWNTNRVLSNNSIQIKHMVNKTQEHLVIVSSWKTG